MAGEAPTAAAGHTVQSSPLDPRGNITLLCLIPLSKTTCVGPPVQPENFPWPRARVSPSSPDPPPGREGDSLRNDPGPGVAPAAGEVRGAPPAPGLRRASVMQGVVHLSPNPWNDPTARMGGMTFPEQSVGLDFCGQSPHGRAR